MKRFWQIITSRVAFVGISVLVQLAIIIVFVLRFQNYFGVFYGFSILLSVVVLLYLVNNEMNPSIKLAWIVPILIFPFFGGIFYLLFGGYRIRGAYKKNTDYVRRYLKNALPKNNDLIQTLDETNPQAAAQSRYLQDYAACPPFQNTEAVYFHSGESFLSTYVEELRKAKKFIFLEYFIISRGIMWGQVLDILKEKVEEGVDVRVIYDDVGSVFTLERKYPKELRSYGIKCCVFNPFNPVVSSRFNNRDHRKITVIDGKVGFTGGLNLSDEYINVTERFGHWKDSALMLKGDAVWSLTCMYLSTWNTLNKEKDPFSRYELQEDIRIPSKAVIQPYMDNPLSGEPVGEIVYYNLINKATRSIHITTPYLVIDNETRIALQTAAKNGIEVEIITPHIPDKAAVFTQTRANYESLIRSGVRIYEYTPGFIHAKNFIVDGEYAVVGTVNMDFRSFYYHFECGVWMYQADCIADIEQDFEETRAISEEITLEWCAKANVFTKLGRSVLRLFSPLM